MAERSITTGMQNPTRSPRSVWTPNRRRLASGLIVAHLSAVFVAPWSGPPPAPLLADRAAAIISPYLHLAYLNHGYRFFAPDPGPSHVLRYELVQSDHSVIHGRIPDPDHHWPRLLYHRHFMITETLFNRLNGVQEIPADVQLPNAQRAMIEGENRRIRQSVQTLLEGLARQLLRQHGGERVKLYLVEHAIPFPQDVQQGKRLDAPDLYTDLADLGEFRESQP
jgi:hypothetical protein